MQKKDLLIHNIYYNVNTGPPALL